MVAGQHVACPDHHRDGSVDDLECRQAGQRPVRELLGPRDPDLARSLGVADSVDCVAMREGRSWVVDGCPPPVRLDGCLPTAHPVDVPSFSSEAALIGEVQSRLGRKFAQIPQDHISTAVTRVHAEFAGNKVRDFIPLLVERRVSGELARMELVTSPERPTEPVVS